MKSFDVKSLIIGILGTALVLVLSGLSSSAKYQLSCGVNCMVMNTSTGKTKIVRFFEKGFIPDSNIEHFYLSIGLGEEGKF